MLRTVYFELSNQLNLSYYRGDIPSSQHIIHDVWTPQELFNSLFIFFSLGYTLLFLNNFNCLSTRQTLFFKLQPFLYLPFSISLFIIFTQIPILIRLAVYLITILIYLLFILSVRNNYLILLLLSYLNTIIADNIILLIIHIRKDQILYQ